MLSSSEIVVVSSSTGSGAGSRRGLDVATGSAGLALPATGADGAGAAGGAGGDAADAVSESLSFRNGRGLVVIEGTGILGADLTGGFDSVGLDGVDPALLNLRTSEGLSSVPLAALVPLSESFRLKRRWKDPLTPVSLPFCNRIHYIPFILHHHSISFYYPFSYHSTLDSNPAVKDPIHPRNPPTNPSDPSITQSRIK